MKLYENITIGNFLFALGYSIRDQQNDYQLKGSVNLLQQTPADKLLGDVLLQFKGVVRLIEFKAQGAKLGKEKGRHAALTVALNERHLIDISKDVHWYIESKATETTLGLRIVPYLDAFPRPQGPKQELLENFVRKLAKDIVTQNVTYTGDQITEYLSWVRRTQGSGTVGSGGLLIVAGPEGSLHFAPLSDLLELNLDHSFWISERARAVEAEHELIIRGELERQKNLSKSYDGPSI